MDHRDTGGSSVRAWGTTRLFTGRSRSGGGMPLDTAACTSGVGEEDIYNDGEGLIDSRRMVLPSFPDAKPD